MSANLIIALVAAIGIVFVLAVFITAFAVIAGRIPKESRAFRDPLPKAMRVIWPIVRMVEHNTAAVFPKSMLRSTRARLEKTKISFMMNETQFISVRIVSGVIACALCIALLSTIHYFSWIITLLCTVLGVYYPLIWLHEIAQRNDRRLVEHLPTYLNLLTMAVESGAHISGAMEHAVKKGPAGPLQREFEHVLRDLRSGVPRADALQRMAERSKLHELARFCRAVIQAEKMGSGLAKTLRSQSQQQVAQRFQLAEKKAMEAPVKLLFPLLVFIFPVTFIVLAFPIVMKFMQGGLL